MPETEFQHVDVGSQFEIGDRAFRKMSANFAVRLDDGARVLVDPRRVVKTPASPPVIALGFWKRILKAFHA
jgi:hypothetical protein